MAAVSVAPQTNSHLLEHAPSFEENPLECLDEWEDIKVVEEEGTAKKKAVQEKLCDSGKAAEEFRNYENNERKQRVQNFYKNQHQNMTHDFAKGKRSQYLSLDRAKMSVWDCLLELDRLVDDSDPDTDVSQLQHALMTAEAIRKRYPSEKYEWFRVVGLIHDLGKILSIKWGEPQWCVVGDTFPVGCKFSDKCVYPGAFEENPDWNHPVYSTPNGIYEPGCGLDNLTLSWGHDEYLYQVCVKNGCTLPSEGLAMIRYHSFYPWHTGGAYTHFMGPGDDVYLKWVREFNQFDLYSKGDVCKNVEELCGYYKAAILRFFPKELNW